MIGRLGITFEGLREMIRDVRAMGVQPAAILLNEFDKNDLKELLYSDAKEVHEIERKRGDYNRNKVLAFVEGVPILSHKDVDRGKARILQKQAPADEASHIIVR